MTEILQKLQVFLSDSRRRLLFIALTVCFVVAIIMAIVPRTGGPFQTPVGPSSPAKTSQEGPSSLADDQEDKEKIGEPVSIANPQQAAQNAAPSPGNAPAPSPSSPTPPVSPATSYVQPGTQGYRGSLSDLTVYSAANGQVPPGQGCSWDQEYKAMDCRGNTLTLDHAYVQGGIYWTGCGTMSITNSIVDWAPSRTWHNIHASCENGDSGASLQASHSTFRTSATNTPYTGSVDNGPSDVGSINNASSRPMIISHSVFKDFPQGLNPPGESVIKYSEIYISDVWCPRDNEWCHSDGLFSQGGDNLLYEGNYIVAQIDPIEATAAIFFQSFPRSSGHRIIGNFIKGGAYTFYNQNADNLVVEGNTFGGHKFGDVSNTGTITSWLNNKRLDGTPVPHP